MVEIWNTDSRSHVRPKGSLHRGLVDRLSTFRNWGNIKIPNSSHRKRQLPAGNYPQPKFNCSRGLRQNVGEHPNIGSFSVKDAKAARTAATPWRVGEQCWDGLGENETIRAIIPTITYRDSSRHEVAQKDRQKRSWLEGKTI